MPGTVSGASNRVEIDAAAAETMARQADAGGNAEQQAPHHRRAPSFRLVSTALPKFGRMAGYQSSV